MQSLATYLDTRLCILFYAQMEQPDITQSMKLKKSPDILLTKNMKKVVDNRSHIG